MTSRGRGEARQVLESQLEGDQAGQAGQAGPDGQDANLLNPFERGPEITEIR